MTHAFSWLSSPYRWVLLGLLIIGTVAFAIKLTNQGKPLRTSVAPNGILSYEFAWSKSKAELILGSWNSITDIARRQIIIDFGFLIVYPLALSLACAMLTEAPANQMAAVGVFISWAALTAGLLDAIENFALLRMLEMGASGSLARLAGFCAGVKFVAVYASLGYIVLQGLGSLIGKLRGA